MRDSSFDQRSIDSLYMGANEDHMTLLDAEPDSTLSRFGITKKLLLLGALASSALMVSLVSWTLSSPLGSSPDENFHIGSIWCADGLNQPRCKVVDFEPTARSNVVVVPHVMDRCFIGYPEQSGNCSWDPKSKQPTLLASGNGAYPTLYYEFMNLFVTDHTQVSGLLIRLWSSIMAATLLLLVILLSPMRNRSAALIGFAATLVPLSIFLIPSINPSSWAYLGIAFGWVFQINAISSQTKFGRASNWTLFYLCTVIAMGSRWDAAIYSCASIVVAIYLARRTFGRLRAQDCVLSLIPLAIGLSTFLNHYLNSGVANAGVFSNASTSAITASELDRNLFNLIHLIDIPAGAFGLTWGLGWLDTRLPTIVGLIGVSIFLYFFISSVPYHEMRFYFVSVLLIFFALANIFYYLWSSGAIVGEVIQPRYILPMLPLILGISIWCSKVNPLVGRDVWPRTILIGSLLSLVNAISLWTNIRRYTLGLEESQGYSLSFPNSPIEWWWRWAPSPNFVFLVGVIAFSIFIFATLKIVNSPKNLEKPNPET